MSGRTASPDTASVTVPGSGDRTPEPLPTPDGSPLLASIRCWTSRAPKAPHRTHAVTIDATWQVTVPHDLESERLAVALGGYLSCLELVPVGERVGAGCRFPTTTRPESGPASAIADARSLRPGSHNVTPR